MTGDRKKEFIKKLCLALKTGILSLVLVLYVSARKHSEWILQRLTLKYFEKLAEFSVPSSFTE